MKNTAFGQVLTLELKRALTDEVSPARAATERTFYDISSNHHDRPEAASPVQMYRATYSPDDNKLRLYAVSRLDPETYKKVHDAGFRWAPKQALFVAPAWTPGREDVLLSLAGEIEDEDSTLAERQEARAERFTGYSGKRASESAQALDEVERLAAMIPPGQPILVGHHSERRARRDAQRIENGMKRAVMLFERAEYWEERARSALLHANKRTSGRSLASYQKTKLICARLKTIAQSQKYLTMWRAAGSEYGKTHQQS
ncbi:hypothetical protein ECZU42_47610 [Escherichia coli]|nr:hypothetical protein ECZU42_47610 [Escherichia coli]